MMEVCSEATERSALGDMMKVCTEKTERSALGDMKKVCTEATERSALGDMMKVCTEATERRAMDIHSPPFACAVFPLVCTNQHKTFAGGERFHY